MVSSSYRKPKTMPVAGSGSQSVQNPDVVELPRQGVVGNTARLRRLKLTTRLVDLDGVEGRGRDHRNQLNRDLAVGHVHRKRLIDGLQPAAGRGDDVEVREHRCAVDRDIEGALAGRGEVQLR